MSVGVVHPSLNRGGGAERVCLGVIKALVGDGFRVRLYTLDRVDWNRLEGRLGNLVRPHEETWLMDMLPIRGEHSLEFYTSTLYPILLIKSRAEAPSSLIINTYGDLIEGVADISYINAIPSRLLHHYPGLNPLYKRIASKAYDLSLKGLEGLFERGLMLTNSRFMQTLLKQRRGYEALVVYPPVDIERFLQNPDGDRENIVVSVSRIRRGKQLESAIRVARMVEEGEFIILGLADQASKDSLESLMKTIRDMGLEDRVKLLINQPFMRFRSALSRAKVYLHTQPMEAFGISVVEAMASGCVPVVPRLGGPWRDILELRNGYYGFGYSSVEEASGRISMLLKDEEERREISMRARLRAEDFDAPIFEDRILRIVRWMLEKQSNMV